MHAKRIAVIGQVTLFQNLYRTKLSLFPIRIRIPVLSCDHIDIPVVVWCLVPMASSLTNGLGAYDGASFILQRVLMWGVPYFIGRLYFNDPQSLRELAGRPEAAS